MVTKSENDPWTVTVRMNKAGNLTIEVELDHEMHCDLVLNIDGTIDLGTQGRPWELGEQGWGMPGAPNPEWRKYRYQPEQ